MKILQEKNMPNKGMAGYIDGIKKDSVQKGLIGLGIFLLIYSVGVAISGSSKNYGTVMAVMVALPTAQALSRYFGYGKYKSVTLDVVEVFSALDEVSVVYEVLLVRGKKNYFLDLVLVSNGRLIVLSRKGDAKALSEIRQSVLSLFNHKGEQIDVAVLPTSEAVMEAYKCEDFSGEVADFAYHERLIKVLLGSAM